MDFDFDHEALLLVGYLERNHGTFQILLLIHRDGSASTSEMRRRLKPGQEAIDSALISLVEAGLVGCESVGTFPFSNSYRLTELGRALVETPPLLGP